MTATIDAAGRATAARPVARLRPGVVMPDWREAGSPDAHRVLSAIFDDLGQAARIDGLTGTEDRVWRAVVELFAFTDTAPTVAAVAACSDLDHVAVETTLHKLRGRDLVLLAGDRVHGAYPFVAGGTVHRVQFGGRQRHAMCAIDALGVGAMCGTDASIASACHRCGRAIALAVRQQGRVLASVSPPDSVVWAGLSYGDNCAATSLCRLLAFFCSDDCLAGWRSEDKTRGNGIRLSISEAFEVGKAIFGPVLAGTSRLIAAQGALP